MADATAVVEHSRALFAAAVGFAIWTYCAAEIWTPLQLHYWGTEMFQAARGNYRLIAAVDRRGQHRIATDSDLMPIAQQLRRPIRFALSNHVRQRGVVESKVDIVHCSSDQMHEWLARQVYGGQSIEQLLRPAWT